ncbi:MAG: pseudouridine synthase [Leptospiraceae bacterium]|nr:MAG: pseudouridine synthase [Leptospiraceae bacterium]
MIDKNLKKKFDLFKDTNQKEHYIFNQNQIRINRYLALCGVGSRREVEKFILEGKVLVNGIPVKDLTYKVKKDDLVIFNGKRITPIKKHIYIALNKPVGYVVSKKQFRNERSIYSLIPKELRRKYNLGYAGRLDKMSRGLVILSSDGLFLHHLTHPKYKVLKKYYVQLDSPLTGYDLNLLTGRGILDDGERLKALSITVKDATKNIYQVVLGEGKKRHIRRMFQALLYDVIDLYRVAIGKLDLEKFPIPEGSFLEFDPSLIWEDSPEHQYLIELYKKLKK